MAFRGGNKLCGRDALELDEVAIGRMAIAIAGSKIDFLVA